MQIQLFIFIVDIYSSTILYLYCLVIKLYFIWRFYLIMYDFALIKQSKKHINDIDCIKNNILSYQQNFILIINQIELKSQIELRKVKILLILLAYFLHPNTMIPDAHNAKNNPTT